MLSESFLESYRLSSGMPEVRVVRCSPEWPERGPTYWEIQEVRSLQQPYQHPLRVDKRRSEGVRLITQLRRNRFASRRQAFEELARVAETRS